MSDFVRAPDIFIKLYQSMASPMVDHLKRDAVEAVWRIVYDSPALNSCSVPCSVVISSVGSNVISV